MYTKTFEVRWSDLDANRHLANSAYINFMSHTRMAYMYEKGLNRGVLSGHNLGPVVFYEHMYYFKEVLPGQTVKVSLEIKGLSPDGMFFEFHHNFYDESGRNLARCEMMGGWIDLNRRALTPLPQDLLDIFNAWERADGFRVLTKEDTRRHAKVPQHLSDFAG
jgi:acyl-CoA thioester hydrolase